MQANQPKDALGPRIVHGGSSDQPKRDDAVVATPTTVSSDDKAGTPPEPTKGGSSNDIPTILLVQAGLTVFNAMIVLVYVGMWMIDVKLLASALRAGAGLALLLSVAPMALGAYIDRKNRKEQAKPPGAMWAQAGVYAGAIMCTMTLMIPLIVTVRSVVTGD